jgi:hypothetical protein
MSESAKQRRDTLASKSRSRQGGKKIPVEAISQNPNAVTTRVVQINAYTSESMKNAKSPLSVSATTLQTRSSKIKIESLIQNVSSLKNISATVIASPSQTSFKPSPSKQKISPFTSLKSPSSKKIHSIFSVVKLATTSKVVPSSTKNTNSKNQFRNS